MYEQVEKTNENISRAVANSTTQKKSAVKQGFEFVDNRQKNITQQVVQGAKNNETHTSQGAKEKSIPPVQRVILYNGTQYNQQALFSKDNIDVYDGVTKLNPGVGMGALAQKARSEVVYDAHNKLAEVEVERVKSKQELRDETGAMSATEIVLPKRMVPYPSQRTLFAPIDKAIVVINNGHYQFIGTAGLINCVEVMIEYQTESDKGYLVAHVNGGIAEDEDEIGRQLQVMLDAMSHHLNKEIKWEDFVEDSETNKLTLVRSAGLGEQKLLINMRNILSESGAHMKLVSSNSASMEITPTGANYFDNMHTGQETDFRSAKGYPFPE